MRAVRAEDGEREETTQLSKPTTPQEDTHRGTLWGTYFSALSPPSDLRVLSGKSFSNFMPPAPDAFAISVKCAHKLLCISS